MSEKPLKIAVVGGGASGLAAFWLLNEHSPHSVQLYEKNDYVGGDAHSISFKMNAEECQVETAFVRSTNVLSNWLTDRSNSTVLEYRLNKAMDHSLTPFMVLAAGAGLVTPSGLFWALHGLECEFSAKRWRLLFDFLRFQYDALHVLRTSPGSLMTVGSFLQQHGYSQTFKEAYLYPLMAAYLGITFDSVSSRLPVARLLRGMHNMCLLQMWHRPPWETVAGGSVEYIKRITSRAPPGMVHVCTEVVGMSRTGRSWAILTSKGEEEFDRVILAGPARGIYAILHNSSASTELVEEILRPKEVQEVEIWIHTDDSLLPKNPSIRSAWNVLIPATSAESRARMEKTVSAPIPQITYDVNRLQNYSRAKYGPILSTQSPFWPIDPSKVHAHLRYTLDMDRYRPIDKLPALQDELGAMGIRIAGAWMSVGIHESAWHSGLQAGIALGGQMPFPLASPDRPVPPPTWRDTLTWCALKIAGILL